MNILVVDDAAEIRAYLKGVLSARPHVIFEASDGSSACELIERNRIDIVLTDWMMPGMNGIELIEWIRSRDFGRYVYTILVTSRGRETDLIEGLSSGADDFLTKPVNANILHARLTVAERIWRIQQDLLTQQQMLVKSRDFLKTAYQSVQDDLADAARVQRSFLPRSGTTMEILTTAWRYRPAAGISGDHFDIRAIDNDTLFFYLLDVSGHGVTAALRAALISQLLSPLSNQMEITRATGPAAVLKRLNQYLVKENGDVDYLATMVMGIMDMRNKNLKLGYAGHPPALLVTDGRAPEEISGNIGLPLAIDGNASYRDNIITMPAESTLVLHSDGLTECENDKGEQFGNTALKRSIEQHACGSADNIADGIESSVDSWRGNCPISDDQTMLIIQHASPPAGKIPENTAMKSGAM